MNQYVPANLIEVLTPQERAKAKRLYKAYRWTWAMYQALGIKQGWRCGICGRSAKNAPLNVDHEHFKVQAARNPDPDLKWQVWTVVDNIRHTVFAKTKVAGVAAVREWALPRSVRGLLCPGRHTGCNRLLGRVDNPDWLEKARNYLLNPPAKDLTK